MSLSGIFPINRWDFKSDSVFTNLPEEDYARLMQHARKDRYKKGQVIFREGNMPGGIYYILEGRVKKYKVDNFEKEQIIYIAAEGELVGYHALLSGERYPDAAATLEECVLLFIPREDFMQVLEQSGQLSMRLLKMLSHEFSVLSNSISVFAQRPVRERLAIALIVLREKFKKGTPEGEDITINMSREDLASMAGTTRENVVRLLRQFKDEQLLETKGRKIWIRDIRKLVTVSNYQ